MKVLVMMKCAVGHDPEVQPWHDKAAEINNLVYSKLAGDYSRNLRSTLLIGYSQAILQYHDAILVLQSHRTLGSAARALHRPLVEAVARALWIYVQRDQDLEQVEKQDYRYPSFKCMMKYLDQRFESEKLFATLSDDWKYLCGLTHTGMEQITQQFDDQGHARPVYDPAQVINSIQSATAVLVIYAVPMVHYFEKPDAAGEINAAYQSLFRCSEWRL
jgi:hypothetical protein